VYGCSNIIYQKVKQEEERELSKEERKKMD
jgi:hypothetical protein